MANRDSFGSRWNLVVVSAVTEIRPKPCSTITAVTETKNIASFGAVTETETEFRSVSTYDEMACDAHIIELAMAIDNGFLHFLHVADDLVKLKQIGRQLLDLRSTDTQLIHLTHALNVTDAEL